MSHDSPYRRVILLGASNLVRSLSTVVETVRLIWQEPVEIMAAIGHGRSYGQNSQVLGRKISGIFPCALWQDLQNRPPLPTAALVTDIGNDLLYDVPVERLIAWVDGSLDRLTAVGADTILTQLPMSSVRNVSEARYRLFRTLLFPKSSLSLTQVKRLAMDLNARLVATAERRKIPAIPVSDAWYGFDPIHLKRSIARTAWPAILSAWRSDVVPIGVPRASLRRWIYLHHLAPYERSVFGLERHCEQPSGILDDGTTISFY
ncbi:MAG TPA: hypothetical protein VGM76_18850 [Lacipirellulaceae bacterium]|jgi:hypothetical protein